MQRGSVRSRGVSRPLSRLGALAAAVAVLAAACGKSEHQPPAGHDIVVVAAGGMSASGSGGAGTGSGGGVNGGAPATDGGAPEPGGRSGSGGAAVVAGAGQGAGAVGGDTGDASGGVAGTSAGLGGEAGADGGGGEGGVADVPGFDDLIVRSSVMQDYEGHLVVATFDHNIEDPSRSEPRWAVVTNGAFELRWAQAFNRITFAASVALFVDRDNDAVCDQDVDLAWAFYANNQPIVDPRIIVDFDPTMDNVGLITCEDFNDWFGEEYVPPAL